MKVVNTASGQVHEVTKYIKDADGQEHIWCNTWYGHHGIGHDCEWFAQPENSLLRWVMASERLPETLQNVHVEWEGFYDTDGGSFNREWLEEKLRDKSISNLKWLEEVNSPNQ